MNSTGTFFTWSNGQTTWAPQIDGPQYIIVSFLPLFLAVLYTIPWRILDSTIRQLEPFYQLHNPDGVLAENSLCLDYSTWLPFVVPYKSIRRGHFMVCRHAPFIAKIQVFKLTFTGLLVVYNFCSCIVSYSSVIRSLFRQSQW